MSTTEDQLKYVKNNLISRLEHKFPNEKIVSYEMSHSGSLDGFMSTLYFLDIKTINNETKKEKLHKLIGKFMKSDVSFRKLSKSYEQFSNEIFIYGTVLPYYEKILNELSTSDSKKRCKENDGNNELSINIKNWTPFTYFAEYGLIQGLSDGKSNESVLVLENIKPLGFRGGPRCFLDREHLLLSVKTLSDYHAFTYVMKIQKDPMLQKFIEQIIPLPFIEKDTSKIKEGIDIENFDPSDKATIDNKIGNNLYEVLYRVAFDRFFLFIEKLKKINDNGDEDANAENKPLHQFVKDKLDNDFFENLHLFKSKWYNKPTELLEYIRCDCINSENDNFPVILHGDFNRNNLLYQYDKSEGFENPISVKMIDFQELRYGTPAIDLSFHMYMNMDPSIRNDFWMKLLTFYHDNMIKTLAEILHVDVEHEILTPFRFEKFNEHFTKYAFYGVLVCMHFLPWMTSTEEEVQKLSHHFETDMHSEDFRQISIDAGGEDTDKLIIEIVQHGIKMGYMKNLL